MYQTEALQAILAFVTGCLNEDEQLANWAINPVPRNPTNSRNWTVEEFVPSEPGAIPIATWVADQEGEGVAAVNGDAKAAHIVRHGPDDVLADVEAKRRIVILHGNYDTDPCLKLEGGAWWHPESYKPCLTLRYVARGYARRPGFLPEWSSEPDSLS